MTFQLTLGPKRVTQRSIQAQFRCTNFFWPMMNEISQRKMTFFGLVIFGGRFKKGRSQTKPFLNPSRGVFTPTFQGTHGVPRPKYFEFFVALFFNSIFDFLENDQNLRLSAFFCFFPLFPAFLALF